MIKKIHELIERDKNLNEERRRLYELEKSILNDFKTSENLSKEEKEMIKRFIEYLEEKQ